MHTYRASWWLYGLTKKKSIISLLTNHFFYSLDVSSCGTERHTKVSHPLAKTEPCYRHVRQFAYPARFLRQEPISRSLRVFRLQFPLILLHLKSYLKIPLIYKGLRPTTSLRSENASRKRQNPNLSSSKPNAS